MGCETFLIASVAGLALTVGALAFQFFNDKKKGEAVRKQLQKEKRNLTTAVIR